MFINAFMECFPKADKDSIVWKSHLLFDSLYYSLVNGQRIDRFTAAGSTKAEDTDRAIEELSNTFAAGFMNLEK